MNLIAEMLAHAREASPNECCGLVVASGKKVRLVRARNVAELPMKHFDLDPAAWFEVGDDESVIGIYHSHPHSDASPSMADLTGCEVSQMPWHIVCPATEEYRLVEPSGYVAPYEKRPYLYGVLDCYTVVRDWYRREWGIVLPDFVREKDFWLAGKNTFVDNIELCGFARLSNQTPEVGDLFLIQHGAKVPNHIVLYFGQDRILHHVENRLSRVDQFGGVWHRHVTHHLRHQSRLGVSNG